MKTKTRKPKVRITRAFTKHARPAAVRRQEAKVEVIELVPSLLKIKHILVPTDFSAPSRKALNYAARFAEQFGARLTLLHVVEPVAAPEFAYNPLAMDAPRIARAGRGRLDELIGKEAIDRRLVKAAVVRFGKPYLEIAAAARKPEGRPDHHRHARLHRCEARAPGQHRRTRRAARAVPGADSAGGGTGICLSRPATPDAGDGLWAGTIGCRCPRQLSRQAEAEEACLAGVAP
jgi:nucleotide-binding universal stress UspA family protein